MKLRLSVPLMVLWLATLAACTPRLGYLNAPQGEGPTGQTGQMVVSNAVVAYSGPLDSAIAYPAGGSAPLSASIVNTGDAADRLVSVSSPIAGGATITGNTALPGGRVLAVGAATGGGAAVRHDHRAGDAHLAQTRPAPRHDLPGHLHLR